MHNSGRQGILSASYKETPNSLYVCASCSGTVHCSACPPQQAFPSQLLLLSLQILPTAVPAQPPFLQQEVVHRMHGHELVHASTFAGAWTATALQLQ